MGLTQKVAVTATEEEAVKHWVDEAVSVALVVPTG